MAKLLIVNKDKPDINVKSFNCKITKLCDKVININDVLYHDGINSLPEKGDKIYTINDMTMQYELFINNTAALYYPTAQSLDIKYLKTNDAGICSIITCN